MKEKPKKKKSNAGRKKIKIDWKKVDNSLMSGSNGVQVAAMLGISFDTLSRRTKDEKNADFAEYLQQKRQEGNDVLFGLQYKLAKEGDRGMLIWLGKNRLDQSDKKEIKQHNTGSLININMTGGSDEPIRTENDIKE